MEEPAARIDWPRHPAAAPVAGVRAWQTATERVTAAAYDLDPHVSVPEHSHAGDEFGVVLEGEIEVVTPGRSERVAAGGCFLIPAGVPHRAATHASRCRLVECYAPGR